EPLDSPVVPSPVDVEALDAGCPPHGLREAPMRRERNELADVTVNFPRERGCQWNSPNLTALCSLDLQRAALDVARLGPRSLAPPQPGPEQETEREAVGLRQRD